MPLNKSRGLDGPFIFTSASFTVYARIHGAGNTAPGNCGKRFTMQRRK
jgi:hypothetical protein